jgi:TolB protein
MGASVWRSTTRAALFVGAVALLGGSATAARQAPGGEVFFSTPRAEGIGQDDIYSVDAGSGDRARVTDTPLNDEGPIAISPDGSQVAFIRTIGLYSTHGGKSWLAVSRTDGTGRRDLLAIPGIDPGGRRPTPSWSPDGRRLAIARAWECGDIDCKRREVWTLDADGGNPRRLSRQAIHPSWSADGTRIAYGGAVGREGFARNVVVANADGTGRTVISAAREPMFAPRGNLVAFFRTGTLGSALWVSGADGADKRLLLREVDSFAWSPDGTRLVVDRAAPSGLWLVDVAGHAQRLTESYRDTTPVWSPDGGRIAWIREGGRNDDLYVMNADGSGERRIPLEQVWALSFPVWSRDGSRLFVAIHRSLTDRELYVMNADGSDQRPLTDNYVDDRAPTVSPDGSRVAFVRQIGIRGIRSALFTMNRDGSEVRQVTSGRGKSDHNPAWSPDGKRIVFSRTRRYIEGDKPDPSRLCIVAASGGRVRCIARYGDEPSWSPDGRLIVYSGFGKKIFTELRVIRPDGTGRRRLVTRMSAGSPGWSRDGRYIAFAGARRTDLRDFSMWIVRRDGTGLRRLHRGGTWNRPAWSADGRSVFYAGFTGKDVHTDLDLFRINRDGTGLVRLTFARGEDVDPTVG